jgi:cyclophilin family peptidyl-prolyl cis-trans isomerase
MANMGKANSSGSQFLFNLVDNPFLDWFNDESPDSNHVSVPCHNSPRSISRCASGGASCPCGV